MAITQKLICISCSNIMTYEDWYSHEGKKCPACNEGLICKYRPLEVTKLKIHYTCSDFAKHEHKTKVGARFCGLRQRLGFWIAGTDPAKNKQDGVRFCPTCGYRMAASAFKLLRFGNMACVRCKSPVALYQLEEAA